MASETRDLEPEMQVIVNRRIAFLIQEAKLNSPRDQAITYTMRAISNYATLGRDAQSLTIKQMNPLISRSAWELLKRTENFANWAGETVNEHPIPLAATWRWLRDQASSLAEIDVWLHFTANKMITITKDEDRKLNSLKLRASDLPTRHADAGIDCVVLSVKPLKYFKKHIERSWGL